MEYEFHADDYVETKDGQIGYITTFIHNHDGDSTILVKYKDGRIQGYKFHDEEPHRFFNRIGQYDFTKKDEGKIEPLCEEYTKSFLICTTTTTNNDLEWRSIDIGAVGKKINELIEVVNELRDKND